MLHKTLVIHNSSPMPLLWPHFFRLAAIVGLLLTLGLLASGVAAAPAPGLTLVSTSPDGLVLELNVPDFELQPAAAGRRARRGARSGHGGDRGAGPATAASEIGSGRHPSGGDCPPAPARR